MDQSSQVAVPQKVRWDSGNKTGIPGIHTESNLGHHFVAWEVLKPELEQEMLIQLGRVLGNRICTAETGEFHGRKNWLVNITDEDKSVIGSVWLGGDPDSNWKWDGLVRAGSVSSDHQALVWQIFERYSDGSYRRIEARDKPEHRLGDK